MTAHRCLQQLEQWETVTSVGDYDAPVVPRPAIRAGLIERWLPPAPRAPNDGYVPDDTAGDTPDAPTNTDDDRAWANAPFVLIAIVNRIDLASDACSTNAGELRFVYGVRGERRRAAPDDHHLRISLFWRSHRG